MGKETKEADDMANVVGAAKVQSRKVGMTDLLLFL